MALTKQRRTEKVNALASELEHSTSAIIGTFTGLTAVEGLRAAQDHPRSRRQLSRRQEQAGGASPRKGTKVEAALQGLKGVTSVAYTSGDPVALAKALSTWVKDNAEFTFKLGIVDGKVITVDEIQGARHPAGQGRALLEAALPDQSPAQRLATVINATGRNLAVVVNQGVEQSKFAGPALHRLPRLLPLPKAEARSRSCCSQGRSDRSSRACRRVGGGRAAFGRSAAGERHRIAGWRSCDDGAGGRRITSFAVISFGCAGLGATETRMERRQPRAASLRETQIGNTAAQDFEISSIWRNKMADIQQLEDQIVSLSLLEASELVKKLEERLGVSAAAAVAAAPAAGGGAAAAARSRREDRVHRHPQGCRREQDQHHQGRARSHRAWLKEAKDLVDGAPKPLKENISKEDAAAIAKKFDGVATVEIK